MWVWVVVRFLMVLCSVSILGFFLSVGGRVLRGFLLCWMSRVVVFVLLSLVFMVILLVVIICC